MNHDWKPDPGETTPNTGFRLRLSWRWPFVRLDLGPNWLSLTPLPGEAPGDHAERVRLLTALIGAVVMAATVLWLIVWATLALMGVI
jgi:hypothetical protein